MHALLLAAAAEKSKTAWYVAGSALALWAVIVAAIGITRPEFPGNAAGRAAVITISVALVATAMAMAVVTA